MDTASSQLDIPSLSAIAWGILHSYVHPPTPAFSIFTESFFEKIDRCNLASAAQYCRLVLVLQDRASPRQQCLLFRDLRVLAKTVQHKIRRNAFVDLSLLENHDYFLSLLIKLDISYRQPLEQKALGHLKQTALAMLIYWAFIFLPDPFLRDWYHDKLNFEQPNSFLLLQAIASGKPSKLEVLCFRQWMEDALYEWEVGIQSGMEQ